MTFATPEESSQCLLSRCYGHSFPADASYLVCKLEVIACALHTTSINKTWEPSWYPPHRVVLRIISDNTCSILSGT